MTRTVPPKRVLALPDLQQSKRPPRTASPQGGSIPRSEVSAYGQSGGSPPHLLLCFGALSHACEWTLWIVLRCRLVGIGSYVRAWLSLFACQVSVAASVVMHGGLVGPCHGAGFRRSRIIVMVGIHILLRDCPLGSEGDHRDRENQKHSSNRFHAAPLKGLNV